MHLRACSTHRSESVPALGAPKGAISSNLIEDLSCRPADRSQPAIELSELASLALCQSCDQFRWNPVTAHHELQRLSRFEVALVSRVSSFGHGA